MNLQIASPPHALLGAALAAPTIREVFTLPVFLYLLLTHALITFACLVNSLYDREVDRRHKVSIARAVERLGVRRMNILILMSVGIVVLLSVILALWGRPLYLLAIPFLGIGYAYSAPPLRLKAKGMWGVLAVGIGLYTLPLLGGWALFRLDPNPLFILFVIGYAGLNEGITLVNTCEDYSEDRKEGITTAAHLLGLRITLHLAWVLVLFGSTACLSALVLSRLGGGRLFLAALSGVIQGMVLGDIVSASRWREEKTLEEQAKESAHRLGPWFMASRYPFLLAALVR